MTAEKRLDIHGMPDRDAALAAGGVKVVNYGTMRSGTSLIFSILCDWYPRNTIVKTHAYLTFPPPDPPIIASYRDFRDAAVSAWRMRMGDEPGRLLTEEEIQHLAAGQIYNAFVLRQYAERRQCLLVRYEEYAFDIGVLAFTLANYLGILLTNDEAKTISQRHSLTRHKQEANGEIPRPTHAPWVEGHIHDGAIGCWERFTPPGLRTMFTDLLAPELERWGYPT